MKRVSDKYYAYYKSIQQFVEVIGNPITIKGFEKCDLFTNKWLGIAQYTVTEGKTGKCFAHGNTPEIAVKLTAKELIDKHYTQQMLQHQIAIAIKDIGLSPRYARENFYKDTRKWSERKYRIMANPIHELLAIKDFVSGNQFIGNDEQKIIINHCIKGLEVK